MMLKNTMEKSKNKFAFLLPRNKLFIVILLSYFNFSSSKLCSHEIVHVFVSWNRYVTRVNTTSLLSLLQYAVSKKKNICRNKGVKFD